MKKTLSLLVVLTLMLCLLSTTAFAQATIIFDGESGDGVVSNNAQPTPAPVTVIDGNGTIISTTDPGVVVITGDVQVTKSPTSETVQEGGKATFVAHAANSTGITWRLVSSDGMATINASAAEERVLSSINDRLDIIDLCNITYKCFYYSITNFHYLTSNL